MAEHIDDELAPDPARIDWWYVVVAAVALQIGVGMSLWYASYILGYAPETIASTLVETVIGVPGGQLLLSLLVVVMLGGVIAPAIALWHHHNELERRGAQLGLRWRVAIVLGIQLWPVSVLTAVKQYRVKQRVNNATHVS